MFSCCEGWEDLLSFKFLQLMKRKPSVTVILNYFFDLVTEWTKTMKKNNNTTGDNSVEEGKSDTSKNIKKGMDRFEEKIKTGEAPAGDATRSDE